MKSLLTPFLSRFTLAQALISQPMFRTQKLPVSPVGVVFEFKKKLIIRL